jgi:hypothetical protein
MKMKSPRRPFAAVLSATALAVAALAPLGSAQAQTATFNFEGAALSGLYLPGDTMSVGGFTLTTLLDFGIVDFASALGLVAPTGNATQFYFNSNEGRLRITRPDGLPFTLDSFAFAFVPLDPPSTQQTWLTAAATLSNDAVVNVGWGFATGPGGVNGFLTGSLGSQQLKSVEFRACAFTGSPDCSVPLLNNGQFAIDDIVLTAVPEPGAALLFALGLVGMAGLRRQARRDAR